MTDGPTGMQGNCSEDDHVYIMKAALNQIVGTAYGLWTSLVYENVLDH